MSEKKARFLTFLVIPDSAGVEVKRLRVPRHWFTVGVSVAGTILLLLLLIAVHDFFLLGELRDVRRLRAENVQLRAQVERMDERVQGMSTLVERVQQFNAQLRKITMLSDPERNLAMGPVGQPASTNEGLQDPTALSAAGLKRDLLGEDRAVQLIDNRLALLETDAKSTEDDSRGLQLYLEDQQALLSATPSLLPARGWRTSSFGFRTDPYTGLQQMHSGLDISANIGTTVQATGDGLVTWSGVQGAFGNLIIIDHGQGLSSAYAHLSEIQVKVGDQVKRGATIAATGNTGRSTGPHLHYEIRLNGIPQDPERFILE
ncbi:MAG: peptidoglycan DD-metalloendopeptidase family protein [Deltaproteobacteria bacterium]|nr:peptidoglycan DD-metalloendopeptidase family protein [Deltaproteobacteria bacterium]